MMWILTRGKISDSFVPRSYASEPLQTAFLHLYKSTIESVGMQTDAYIASGAAGVVKMTTGRSATKLRTQVQEMIRIGMHKSF
jgi:hypothetical protein